jgi:hypothetical protein
MNRHDGSDGTRQRGVIFAPQSFEEHFLRRVNPVGNWRLV